MKAEPSKLSQLVIAYYEKFGRHVLKSTLRRADAGCLAEMLETSLVTDVPISDAEWGYGSEMEFSQRGCVRDRNMEGAAPTKGADGDWL